MRILMTRKVKRLGAVALSVLLVLVLVCCFAGFLGSRNDRSDVDAVAADESDSETRDVWEDSAETLERTNNDRTKNALLLDAMALVGVCEPEDAAEVWVTGLMKRNAAMQYAVLGNSLREEYVKHLEQTAPNWVTGMSSPWVSGYEVSSTEEPAEDTVVMKLLIHTATSTGAAGDLNAILTLKEEDGFWRIMKLAMDEGLYPYTGFQVPK